MDLKLTGKLIEVDFNNPTGIIVTFKDIKKAASLFASSITGSLDVTINSKSLGDKTNILTKPKAGKDYEITISTDVGKNVTQKFGCVVLEHTSQKEIDKEVLFKFTDTNGSKVELTLPNDLGEDLDLTEMFVINWKIKE